MIGWLVVVMSGIFLAGCASEAHKSAAEYAQQTQLESSSENPTRIWSGPELEVSHFRMRFYGYDTVSYRLIAVKPDQANSPPLYRLFIEANYGGTARHYNQAKFGNGVIYPTNHLNHEFLRCQFFGDMADACLFRDRADIELSLAELEAGSHTGLTVTLGSRDLDYETISIPAEYVEGFLLTTSKN